ncbi:MAG: metallophosphoesterase [Candidatus Neomarinimicrobiota bacterium]
MRTIQFLIFFSIVLTILGLVNYYIGIHGWQALPAGTVSRGVYIAVIAFCASCGIVCLIVLAGFVNAQIQKVTTLDLRVHKKVEGFKTLNIAAASDLHLGTLVGVRRVRAVAEIMRKLNPDIILFAGDILDEDMAPAVCKNICGGMENVRPRFGFFTVPGNHEHYGGMQRALAYLTEHRITVLRDEVVKIDDLFYIVGREDPGHGGSPENRRKPLKELLAGVEPTKPIVLLDSRPEIVNIRLTFD